MFCVRLFVWCLKFNYHAVRQPNGHNFCIWELKCLVLREQILEMTQYLAWKHNQQQNISIKTHILCWSVHRLTGVRVFNRAGNGLNGKMFLASLWSKVGKRVTWNNPDSSFVEFKRFLHEISLFLTLYYRNSI